MYVGKTKENVQKRFKEHKRASFKETCNKRPLYRAFKKYGFENFIVEEIFVTEDEKLLAEKEIYFISLFNTYKKGYNATKGGDGRGYLELSINDVVNLYNESLNISYVGREFNCDPGTIRSILKKENVNLVKKENWKGIQCLELNKIFEKRKYAAQFLIDNQYTDCKNELVIRKLLSKSVMKGNKYCGLTWVKYTTKYQTWE